MKNDSEPKQELLIIRRGGGDGEGGHHGGAWKIAYADFVTAMMAFFLVMWLINSANEVTKSRVASYFNPIKMTDASPAKRGLKETTEPQSPKNNLDTEESGQGHAAEKSTGEAAASAVKVSEGEMLQNPYAYLDDLVKHASLTSGKAAKVGDSQVIGDPFDPQSYEMLSKADDQHQDSAEEGVVGEHKLKDGSKKATLAGSSEAIEKLQKADSESDHSGEALSGDRMAGLEKEGQEAAGVEKKGHDTAGEEIAGDVAAGLSDFGAKKAGEAAADQGKPLAKDLQLAKTMTQEIERKIKELSPSIDIKASVRVTKQGVLVVLEDGGGRSMFSVGSAQPNPALVEIIGKVGEILMQQEGSVVVRGHTDARRFRTKTYDNWQLSTERAHMASYMLIRGGLPEGRIAKIEGYGSSEPINPENPMADENRRVEFLLTR